MSAGSQFVVTATAGYPVKRNKSHSIDSWVFDALTTLGAFASVSPGAGVARTTNQATIFMAQSYKIAKVGVYFTAIDAVTGGDSFNIKVGTGTANASGISGNTAPFDRQRNDGYPTAFASAGQLVFDTDVAFNVTNFPNIATGTGGYNEFAPYNYDGCYLPGPLSLIATTVASTGSITGLVVVLVGCYIDTNCGYSEGGVPTQDF